MKTIATILFALAAATAFAAPMFEVMPELAGQVNAQTTNNAIPWYGAGKYDAMVTAQLDTLIPLVGTRQGDYDYTLYRARFHNVKVIEGELQEKELTFYLERRFPTPESGIRLKELWPFQKGCVRVFKVNKAGGKLQIVSMEMEAGCAQSTLTADDAIRLSRQACAGKVDIPADAQALVMETNGTFVVTFPQPFQPGVRHGDIYACITIGKATGKVMAIKLSP